MAKEIKKSVTNVKTKNAEVTVTKTTLDNGDVVTEVLHVHHAKIKGEVK